MFSLDPVIPYTLSNPPLVQALLQVRFPLVAKLNTFEGISSLQDALLVDFPTMRRVSETALSLNATGLDAKPEETISWHFSDESDRLFVISPNSITLSLGLQYLGISDFITRFHHVVEIVHNTYGIRKCERIGARFLDVVPDLDGDSKWTNWFTSDVVGWATSEIVHGKTNLQASVSQIQLASPPTDNLAVFPADIQAVIRHGVAPKSSILPGFPPITIDDKAFFLDMDLFVAGMQDFDVARIIQQAKELHSQIDRFFRWTLTESGEKHFGLQEK